jgi:mannose/fructose/N-acetylgalactosamine-specific phosphotransferase system component IID
MIIEVLKDLGILVMAPILRSFFGWLSFAMKDKKITKFEIRKLFYNIIKIGTMGVFAYTGFKVAGVTNPALAGAVASFFADKILDSIKENKSVRK